MIRTTGAEQQRRQIGRTVSSRDAQEVYVVVFIQRTGRLDCSHGGSTGHPVPRLFQQERDPQAGHG
tara:strand:- start:322 stop:519 length:198 start_codon:yes stop_codon:yes gene_type:complete